MPAGSVSVAADGTVTKSGLAEAIYDQRVAMLPLVQPPGVVPAGPAGVPLKKGLALDANALATAIFTYLSTNIEATGSIKAWSTASAPTGWLLCDATAVSRTTYADLFALIGTTFGAGDGSTTFNLPDLRGRAPIGAGTGDAADATAHALASKTGTEGVTLNTTQIPSHAHSITDPQHQHGSGQSGFVVSKPGTGTLAIGAGSDYAVVGNTANASTGVSTDNVGGGGAHSSMQPSLTLNFIIKT